MYIFTDRLWIFLHSLGAKGDTGKAGWLDTQLFVGCFLQGLEPNDPPR